LEGCAEFIVQSINMAELRLHLTLLIKSNAAAYVVDILKPLDLTSKSRSLLL
tara:strand:- start:750 stop:905 length:156 start_codon:yes stop_codon:yes gene_type:complete